MCIPQQDFENMYFNPLNVLNDTITQNNSDPDTNFYNDISLQNNVADYYCPNEVLHKINSFEQQPGFNNNFSALHINARSLNKNIENFKTMLNDINHEFKILAITESWLKNSDFIKNANFDLPNYSKISYERSTEKTGGGICAYIITLYQSKLERHTLSGKTLSVKSDEFFAR